MPHRLAKHSEVILYEQEAPKSITLLTDLSSAPPPQQILSVPASEAPNLLVVDLNSEQLSQRPDVTAG